jgi:hypothetical protein
MMKKLYIVLVVGFIGLSSCGQSNQQDNATHNNDTMVIKQDKTDTATNSVSTDTTKR